MAPKGIRGPRRRGSGRAEGRSWGRLVLPAILLLPLVEIAGFVWIGPLLGVWGTLLWTLMAALIGLRLLSRESVGALKRAEQALRTGRSPAVNVADAGLAALAGILLIIPGFITDIAGLALALRPVRLWIAARAMGRFGLARARHAKPGVGRAGGWRIYRRLARLGAARGRP